ncbi:recombinase family protein [Mesorhizobium sp. VNQ89]|uniref:recombinase family protein n=1 Tax=Mesorhizobium quangtriensis TaxID=3157709 RepID=UPI0032B792BF
MSTTLDDEDDGVSYLRVSSKEQSDGFSIPAQRKLYLDYIKKIPVKVHEEFVDIESAKQSGRRNFQRMVEYLTKNPHIKTILVEKVDRLYRNPKDWITLEELGVNIHFIKENTIISPNSRSSDKLMHGIKVVMAKNFIDNLKEEVRKGMHEKASQGMWPSYAPIGYLNTHNPAGKDKIIVPCPETSFYVYRIFELCAEGKTLDEIQKICKSEGFRFGKYKRPLQRSLIHRVLRNRIYTGDFDYAGIFYIGSYEPLISIELWQRAQDTLDGRGSCHDGGPHEFVYKGLISCSHCGCAVTGDIKKGKYVYYEPTAYRTLCTRDPKACRSSRLPERLIDPQVAEALGSLTIDPELLQWVRSAWNHLDADRRATHEDAIARLEAESERLQKRLDAMYVDKLEGRVEEAQFARLSNQWQREQVEVLREAQGHRDALKTSENEGVKLLEFAHEALATFSDQNPEQRRRLLKIVLSNCTWDDGKVEVTFRQPFDLLIKKRSEIAPPDGQGAIKTRNIENWCTRQDSNL